MATWDPNDARATHGSAAKPLLLAKPMPASRSDGALHVCVLLLFNALWLEWRDGTRIGHLENHAALVQARAGLVEPSNQTLSSVTRCLTV